MHQTDFSQSGRLEAFPLTEGDLERLVRDIEVRVTVRPLSGMAPASDYWAACLEDLSVEQVDLGLDAALVGLTLKVSARVQNLLAELGSERDELLPLLTKLWAWERRGELGAMLQRVAVAIDYEYDLYAS